MLSRGYEKVRSTALVSKAVQKERKLMELGLVVTLSSYLIFQLFAQVFGLF